MSVTPITIRHPRISDGADLWRMAHDSQVLDVNASYAYLLWCRDFAATSAVATLRGDAIPFGFITGYVRPEAPVTLMVWQVAVDAAARGHGVAASMLDWLWRVVGDGRSDLTHLETTITPDNAASHALFVSFAKRHDAGVHRSPLFTSDTFASGDHGVEYLYRIGPMAR